MVRHPSRHTHKQTDELFYHKTREAILNLSLHPCGWLGRAEHHQIQICGSDGKTGKSLYQTNIYEHEDKLVITYFFLSSSLFQYRVRTFIKRSISLIVCLFCFVIFSSKANVSFCLPRDWFVRLHQHSVPRSSSTVALSLYSWLYRSYTLSSFSSSQPIVQTSNSYLSFCIK